MKALKAFIKPFEAPQRSVKIKASLNFFSSSGIGKGRVKAFHSWKFVPIPNFTEANRSYNFSCPQLVKVSGKAFSKRFSKTFLKKDSQKVPNLEQ